MSKINIIIFDNSHRKIIEDTETGTCIFFEKFEKLDNLHNHMIGLKYNNLSVGIIKTIRNEFKIIRMKR